MPTIVKIALGVRTSATGVRWLAMALVLGASIVLAPTGVEAQQPAARSAKIGFLWTSSATGVASYRDAFAHGLRALGYAEGRGVKIHHFYADDQLERLSDLAAQIVRLDVDVIVTQGTPAARAAKQATAAIPIVFVNVADPVASGLVATLSRPGGHVTGLTIVAQELSAKRLELLKEAIPRISRVAILQDAAAAAADLRSRQSVEAAAQPLGLQLQILDIRSPKELENAFATAKRRRADALLVLPSPVLNYQRKQLVDLAATNRLPASYQAREFVDAGGLMSYGPRLSDVVQRAAIYVDKILKGARPADLPVEQPTKFELVIHAKTARALGLTISPSILTRADDVVQ
jgi:putative ABC transport system substrate-binding protein